MKPRPSHRAAAADPHRTLPHSLEAEKGLLSSMLLSPAEVGPLAAGLPASAFYLPAHQTIYQLLTDRWNVNQPADVITLTQALRDQGVLAAVGGPAFVTEIFAYVPTAANASHYLETIQGQAKRRAVIALSSHATAQAYEPGADVEELLSATRGHLEHLEARGAQETPCRKLGELRAPTPGDDDELIRHRYLCRGGGLLLVGPTGIGKSSFSLQLLIMWALGRECFGLVPARPLRSLIIQAENDDGDIAEMRDGVLRGLSLPLADRERATAAILIRQEDARTGAEFFARTVEPLLRLHRSDLLVIDPALAYLGGETSSQADVGGFLRNGLNPLLHRYGCAGIVVHHTNKPPSGQEKNEWAGGDFAYLGSGSAEWANWPRAVIAIRSRGSHDVFDLVLGKRGGRAGWTDPGTGGKAFAKLIGHATEPGAICWREVDPTEVAPTSQSGKRLPQPEDLMEFIPQLDPVEIDNLLGKVQAAGTMGVNKARDFLAVLKGEERVFEWHLPRPGKRPMVAYARHAQPASDQCSRPSTSPVNTVNIAVKSDVHGTPRPPVGGVCVNMTTPLGNNHGREHEVTTTAETHPA